ncbi:ATPase [Pseudomonas nicosulfuronedens]|uniref:ATPase n=1 Tax=Pseudomonas nicosulfuronedens TaxID=2571105 RepID=A0A5R9R745_9PSED|nr:ATPase [Pseudomonas nicosulfuronedens]MDH1009678.1 ATPase [Pseudomonas nicosulfuronedens]MDH1980977.1 ATPase [Pseudomonas nicosulfuronedens]MDH2027762.1 ATPase [Pseudomonas nicosulfuronedens]TLX78664.1 ATPase [Pseudomonas nicosulfuronedens]
MRNDTFDEFDDVPHLSTDAADRDEFGHHPRRVVEPNGRPQPQPVKRGGGTGALWALVAAMAIALAGVGWWSHQQLLLMEQQLIATQESFAKISEEAAGRLDDIRGKFVANESNGMTDREALKLQVKQLQGRLAEQAKAQQTSLSEFDGAQGKRLAQVSADLKAQQESAALLMSQLDVKLKSITDEQAKYKNLQADLAAANQQIQALNTEIANLKKDGSQAKAIKSIQDDLFVLRSEVDGRQGQASSDTKEFDVFRIQVMRNINTLQQQMQNLQQQISTR